MACSEELLSGLLDNELDSADKRLVALHATRCPRCAQTLGQLYATKAALEVPVPRFRVPRSFWGEVRQRLDQVDSVIRATDQAPRRQRVVSPLFLAASVAVMALAVLTRVVLLPPPDALDQLTSLHLAAAAGPHDPGLHQAVGFRTEARWQPTGNQLAQLGDLTVAQTVYNVGGLPVSVFHLPSGFLNLDRLVPYEISGQNYHVMLFAGGTLVACDRQGRTDVLIARTPPADALALAVSCPTRPPLPGGL
jgi:anti-sigma factor RsiW